MINTTSTKQTIVLSNTGNAPLAILSVVLSGMDAMDFLKTTSCGASLPPGATCNINVFFRPMAAGMRSAALTVTTNDPVNPSLIVMVSGIGVGLSPVGDGNGTTTAAGFFKSDTVPGQIDVTYDATNCATPKAIILYGNIGSYTGYAGCAQSNAGSAGFATIDGTALNNVWFNIVWTNGTTAGSPGFANDGVHDVPRTWPAAGQCGITTDDQARLTCP